MTMAGKASTSHGRKDFGRLNGEQLPLATWSFAHLGEKVERAVPPDQVVRVVF